MPQQQQQQPRRILEKSRTVRRRYQRSNKRFEFSASQIRRIEREEEREKKAKQIREREKKKLANKRKRAEKEAKEREERRRLGIPEPNACKIPASQPLLLNFFGAGGKRGVDKEQVEEETEDSVITEGSEASEEESSFKVEYENMRESVFLLQEEEAEVTPQQQSQQSSKRDDEHFRDLDTDLGEDITVQGQESDVIAQQESQHLNQADGKTHDMAHCVSEDFSDLETELGDDWLDDLELEKHMASIENTQESLSPSAVIRSNDQPMEAMRDTTNTCAVNRSMTESFEDDTSLMLQALDPTVLEEFETLQPKAVLHNVTQMTPVVTPADMARMSQHMAQKQQLRTNATSSNMKTSTVHNPHPTFKKPAVAASTQPRRLPISPMKSVSQSTKIYQTPKVHIQPHFDTDDEFGDLPLSTQDVRELDSMVGFG